MRDIRIFWSYSVFDSVRYMHYIAYIKAFVERIGSVSNTVLKYVTRVSWKFVKTGLEPLCSKPSMLSLRVDKPKFHYADFPATSTTKPWRPRWFVRNVADFPVSTRQTGLLPTCHGNFSNHLDMSWLPHNQGRSDGGISVYTLPKSASGQVSFLWSNNDVRTVIELIHNEF